MCGATLCENRYSMQLEIPLWLAVSINCLLLLLLLLLLFRETKIHEEKECGFNIKIHHKFSSKIMITFKKYNSKLCYTQYNLLNNEEQLLSLSLFFFFKKQTYTQEIAQKTIDNTKHQIISYL